MKKIHLKNKIKLIDIIAILFVLAIIGMFLIFKYIKNRIMPSLFEYGSLEAKKFSSIIINDAVDKYITDNIDIEKLFIVTSETNGEIKSGFAR